MRFTEAETYDLYVAYLEPMLREQYGHQYFSYQYDFSGAYVLFPYFDISFDAIDFASPEASLASIRHKEEIASILYI